MTFKIVHLTKSTSRQLLVWFISFLAIFLTTAHSQTVPSLFVVVEFIKVEPQNLSNYLEVEQEVWKPLHEERVKQGIIVGWYLYAVEFSGTADGYNYVVINLYDSAERLENPWNASILENVHPDLQVDEITKRTQEFREIVKSELYYSIATAPEIPLEIPASYLQVNYMHVEPGKESEYEQLESDVWLPIHNESIQSRRTVGWGLWRALFPTGAGQDYQYITLNTFSEFSTIFGLDFSIPFNNIHPQIDYSQIMQKTQEVRTVMRTELWDLIDYVIR